MLYTALRNIMNFPKNSKDGFSLIEMLIVVALLTVIVAIAASVFTNIIGPSKQEAKIGEAQLESIIGLNVLVSDIQHAGFGLPYSFEEPTSILYTEATGVTAPLFNDAPNGVPRAIVGNQIINAFGNLSSYLVIKASNVGMNAASQRWSELGPNGATMGNANANDLLVAGDNAIMLKVSSSARRQLVMTGATYSATWGAVPAELQPSSAGYNAATEQGIIYVAYGLDTTAINRPFNRADYFINAANVPVNCAPNTGVLAKHTVNHADGSLTAIPIIDCVASFQVFYGLDTTADGVVDLYTPNLTAFTAVNIRNMVKEVWVYILMHEGRRDPNFTFTDFTGGGQNMMVGSVTTGLFLYPIANNQLNYRWKLLSFVVRPKNL
jgi:prepilin-type N-terminal cleavage/methylation domain-containing protein